VGKFGHHSYRQGTAEYLGSTDSEIINHEEELTFLTNRRKEIIDFTLCSRDLVNEIHRWRALPEPSLLDHRYVLFNCVKEKGEKVNYRNPLTTCWVSCWEELQAKLHRFLGHFGTVEYTDCCRVSATGTVS
jgi:hypothetical protein